MKYKSCFIVLLLAFSVEYCSGDVFYIGATLDKNQILNEAMLEFAKEKANKNILNGTDIELGFTIAKIDYGNEFGAAQGLCELLESKNRAIIGPKSPSASSHIASICDAKEIPFIDTYVDIEAKTSTVNVYPSQETLSQLLIDVVDKYGWQDFTILYEAPSYIARLARLLEDRNRKAGNVIVQPIEVGTSFRHVLQKIKDMDSRSTNILIESSVEHLGEIMDQALQVGLFTPDRNFIISNLDAQTIDLERFQYTQANITLFRIIDEEFPYQEFKDFGDFLEAEKQKCDYQVCPPGKEEELSPFMIQTGTALIYDGIMILAQALKQIGVEHLRLANGLPDDQIIECFNAESAWSKGYTLINFMKNSDYLGLTKMIEFDTKGLRSNIEIDVMSLHTGGLTKIGTFKTSTIERLTFLPPPPEIFDPNENRPINEMTFNVIVALTDPYIMLKDTSTGLSGNDRFEGFGIDIIDELSQLYGFKYNFIQGTSDYGHYDNASNSWTGMIGMIHNGTADLAITDLTINSDRITALDFTPSFMNLGIALLYRKPTKEPPSTFSFMSPFSSWVWVWLGFSYIVVSLCFFCLGRISPSQWENRYPCVEEPTFLENQFTLNNSAWFAIGALLQQGSEIEPKCASIRLASSFWWFFTLIMVSSYTANLAMFLVIENKTSKIPNGVEDLKDCGVEGKECPIKFGAKSGGATFSFFAESENELFHNMYNYMLANPDVMTKSNDEGIARVYDANQDYGFLMESSSIEYITERKCNLTLVGEKLDDKNYGIGMRKNFKYHAQLSEGVLQLQERGVLATLQKKWWKERKGGGACSDEADAEAVPLEMANLAGVFYVLLIGSVIAVIYGAMCLIWEIHIDAKRRKKDADSEAAELKFENLKGVFLVLLFGSIFASVYGLIEAFYTIYRKATSAKISFKEELIAEMKFLTTCQGVKEVRHRKGSKSQYSGTSSRYSGGTNTNNSQVHGSNALLSRE